MKRSLFYIAFIALLMGQGVGALHAQDYARMSERTILGTARYVGMSGAMTAIGGDPSSVIDNPAGLGLYRRSEILLTMGGAFDKVTQAGTGSMDKHNSFLLPHASVVFSMPFNQPENDGVQFFNFMLSYNRLQTYNRNYYATGANERSLGALLAGADVTWDIPFCADKYNAANSLSLYESGYKNEYSMDFAMNISNQWYVGLGIQVQSWVMASDALYKESFSTINADGKNYDIWNESKVLFSGASCNLSVGMIYRPLSWLRIGFGLRTPTLGWAYTRTSGTLSATTDSLRYSYAPNKAGRDGGYHMPLYTSTSVAFQIGGYGMISLQYDYSHASFQDDIHSLKAGIEIVPVVGLYINAGYTYESTFKKADRIVPMDSKFDRQDTYFLQPRWTQYASVGIGYRGSFLIIQGAYQYRWQGLNLYAHENAAPYDLRGETHRFVVTIGWHHNR